MSSPLSYVPLTWLDTASGNTPLSAANLNRMEQGIVNAFTRTTALFLNPTVIRTGNFTISTNDLGRFDATAAPITSTLPGAIAGMLIAVKKMDSTTNAVTFNPAGTDTIDGLSQSIVLRLGGETRTLIGMTGGWIQVHGLAPVPALDNRYANPPMFYAVQTVTQTIADGASSAITFSTEVYDVPAAHSLVTNTSRYTCAQAGWYQVSGCVNFVFAATGTRGASIFKNGIEYAGGSCLVAAAPTITSRVATPTVLMPLAIGDYVELYGYQKQTTNATLATDVTGAGSSFTLLYAHP